MTSRACEPHRVVVLAVAPVIGYDLTIPPQVLGEAYDAAGRPLYDVQVVSLDGAPVRATRGYAIAPSAGPEALATAQTVIVPGTQLAGPRRDGTLPDDLRAALATVPADARWVSICTGAFVLAAAGVLDGHRATTHWKYAADFRRLHPGVAVDEDVLFTDDGRVLTSAGLSAGIDLCLHLVRRDHGTAVANAVARHMVVPPWRDGGQAQYIERTVPQRADETTAAARAWAEAHLDQRLDVATLAEHASMSVRTFTRRFREETGQSPGAWVTQQRVRHALHLLEASDLGVDEVASRAGMGTAASLRQHLRASVGVSPSAYRRTFRGAPPATTDA
ncbi:GlxA family transcriptional regulator [Nocardioides sp. zg-1228]|uniref:GlxA family transcriptional regulator n=1 Tax=Nocardioides sp. zg-1228 TaxID=2763008 RepID=UPI00164344BC|nr:helix-turn-helix domain-containing protein [Nocardioides sp. zg-1228]MBC2932924.1 helix-turn-helix domain-containing protein [Nocardioides sp. zg-1228]QSF56873.1 helix-turn-helix domain-containing protein [Nocardioides sp. zg-1228]